MSARHFSLGRGSCQPRLCDLMCVCRVSVCRVSVAKNIVPLDIEVQYISAVLTVPYISRCSVLGNNQSALVAVGLSHIGIYRAG